MPTDCASTLDPMYKSFQINDVLYTRYKLARVISLNPYFTTDTSSEKSCLSTLLMHMPWNVAGEESLLIIRDQTFSSAVEAVQHAIDNNLFPLYVKDTMLGMRKSEAILRNTGEASINNEYEDYVPAANDDINE